MDMLGKLSALARERWVHLICTARTSRTFILFLVFQTNLLDNLLLTAVVPIIPDYLLDIDKRQLEEALHRRNDSFYENGTGLLVVESVKVSENSSVISFAKRILQLPLAAVNENSKVGWLLSSKALVQLIANGFVGPLSNRTGYNVVLFCGTWIVMLSSTTFAFAETYVPLFLARSLQGLGSAGITIAGMSMLAEKYPDDKGRSRAMGLAMGGSAAGILLGYPIGGFLYAFIGKSAPFLLISSLMCTDALLQLMVLRPSFEAKIVLDGTPLHKLLMDPQILVASGAVMFTTMSMANLEPTVPIWIMDTMHVEKWQLGLVFLPDSIGYLIGTNGFPVVARAIGRWICTMSCMVLVGLCLICIPFATSIPHLILPHFGLGLGLGITDAAIMPLLALLVDTRHVAVYGSVYAIAQLAVCLAYGLGPSIAGQVVKAVGFTWLMWGMAILNVVYSPLCWILKDPSTKEENMPILDDEEKPSTYTEGHSFNYQTLHEEE